jgi:hypothetical protein
MNKIEEQKVQNIESTIRVEEMSGAILISNRIKHHGKFGSIKSRAYHFFSFL